MFTKLTATAMLAAIPAMAIGQAPAKPDEDKPVTRIQVSDRLDTDYADLDTDKDGKVVAAEINARLLKGAQSDLAIIRSVQRKMMVLETASRKYASLNVFCLAAQSTPTRSANSKKHFCSP